MPKASASSLPLNQRAMMALCATTSDSDPAPKTKRPAKSIQVLSAKATMTAPRVTSAEKSRLALRGPEAVDEHAAEEDDEDRRERVGRVEAADRLAGEAELLDQRRRQRADAVVGEVGAEGQQAQEEEQDEAVEPGAGVEAAGPEPLVDGICGRHLDLPGRDWRPLENARRSPPPRAARAAIRSRLQAREGTSGQSKARQRRSGKERRLRPSRWIPRPSWLPTVRRAERHAPASGPVRRRGQADSRSPFRLGLAAAPEGERQAAGQ